MCRLRFSSLCLKAVRGQFSSLEEETTDFGALKLEYSPCSLLKLCLKRIQHLLVTIQGYNVISMSVSQVT